MHVASEAGHFHVVERLTEAKADLEAIGGEFSRGAPEARKVDQRPEKVGPKMEGTKRRVTGLKKLMGQSASGLSIHV